MSTNIDVPHCSLGYTGVVVRGSIESGYYWPYAPPPVDPTLDPGPYFEEFAERIKQIKKEREKNMRHLYHIYIVDPKTGTLVLDVKRVATDETQAILKANIPDKIRDNLEDYDLIIRLIGDVRTKTETQKVKVVTDD